MQGAGAVGNADAENEGENEEERRDGGGAQPCLAPARAAAMEAKEVIDRCVSALSLTRSSEVGGDMARDSGAVLVRDDDLFGDYHEEQPAVAAAAGGASGGGGAADEQRNRRGRRGRE